MRLAFGLGYRRLVLQLCVLADGRRQEVPLPDYSQADRSGGAAPSSEHLISCCRTSACATAYAAVQAPYSQQQLDLLLCNHQ
jgi:hypothetical protein